MCQISHELQLCTCENTEDLENSWELYRYHEDQELLVVGNPCSGNAHAAGFAKQKPASFAAQ